MGAGIFTEADSIEDLYTQIRDAVHCHFEENQVPSLMTRDAVLQHLLS